MGMSRADRRTWADARTLNDLGQLMARWLEGDLKSWPGYAAGYGPDEETRPLIRALAAANRAGFLTTCSQPGTDGTGYDGAHWRQRAAVDGFVADPDMLQRVRRAAQRHGLRATTGGQWTCATDRNGEPITVFGQRVDDRVLRSTWHGIHRTAYRAVADAQPVAVVHPVWGPSGTGPLQKFLAEVAR
ncbi:DUF6919 domain-containing protein [Streptomyces sp. AA1529]|uniref:DUF6919 domain-containing protein n=1 Tax=Streptomyces sp. AA1529 TaxID=1203257 RepID=UPI00031D8625|nr:hypothetical protein [Streptomyces sp. AA1529]